MFFANLNFTIFNVKSPILTCHMNDIAKYSIYKELI